ncbi:hypothetical protein BG09_5706 [Bacillus thuringiensis serovar kurstaki str. HD-1]|nr:hypothetical protein BG09_5706 [Bacillus thuringiensis serovar kurstaki str. HD-1]
MIEEGDVRIIVEIMGVSLLILLFCLTVAFKSYAINYILALFKKVKV